MRPIPRLRVLITLAAVALLAAGCGVQPTGVIPAGPAPSMAGSASRFGELTLYFVLDGRLTSVPRPWHGRRSPDIALGQLFEGPTPAERSKGFVSLLPSGAGPSIRIGFTDGSPTVTVPYPLQKLSPDGLNQIACTTVAALTAEGGFDRTGAITLIGPDLADDQLVCGAT